MPNLSSSRNENPFLAVVIIGCAFFFFLTFAQFGFLHRLTAMKTTPNLIELALSLMGAGGITGSIFTSRKFKIEQASNWLVAGFVGCGLSAIASIVAFNIWIQFLVSLCVGLFLGSLTVSIVPLLYALVPPQSIGFWASLGVGGAYFLSNVPQIFDRPAEDHCLLGAFICCVGLVPALSISNLRSERLREPNASSKTQERLFQTFGVLAITAMFLVLIWLDSAAFYVIQGSSALKGASWTSDAQLWSNAGIHLVIAVIAGRCLDRGWLFPLLIASLFLLVLGSWLLRSDFTALGQMPTWTYVTGVSLYSVGLVAYGALHPEKIGLWSIQARAGIVFSMGGWFGSGLGIGMARDLNTIPIAFLISALLFTLLCAIALWNFIPRARAIQPE